MQLQYLIMPQTLLHGSPPFEALPHGSASGSLGTVKAGLWPSSPLRKTSVFVEFCSWRLLGAPLSDVLSTQLKSNPANAPILGQAQTSIETLKTGTKFDTTGLHPGLMPLFRPQVQGFLIDAFSYDPTKLIAAYSGPVLILQGSRDIQVGVADAELLARAKPEVKLAIIPDANHVLKQVTSDDHSTNLATYANPNLPLAAGIVDTLAEFVKSQK